MRGNIAKTSARNGVHAKRAVLLALLVASSATATAQQPGGGWNAQGLKDSRYSPRAIEHTQHAPSGALRDAGTIRANPFFTPQSGRPAAAGQAIASDRPHPADQQRLKPPSSPPTRGAIRHNQFALPSTGEPYAAAAEIRPRPLLMEARSAKPIQPQPQRPLQVGQPLRTVVRADRPASRSRVVPVTDSEDLGFTAEETQPIFFTIEDKATVTSESPTTSESEGAPEGTRRNRVHSVATQQAETEPENGSPATEAHPDRSENSNQDVSADSVSKPAATALQQSQTPVLLAPVFDFTKSDGGSAVDVPEPAAVKLAPDETGSIGSAMPDPKNFETVPDLVAKPDAQPLVALHSAPGLAHAATGQPRGKSEDQPVSLSFSDQTEATDVSGVPVQPMQSASPAAPAVAATPIQFDDVSDDTSENFKAKPLAGRDADDHLHAGAPPKTRGASKALAESASSDDGGESPSNLDFQEMPLVKDDPSFQPIVQQVVEQLPSPTVAEKLAPLVEPTAQPQSDKKSVAVGLPESLPETDNRSDSVSRPSPGGIARNLASKGSPEQPQRPRGMAPTIETAESRPPEQPRQSGRLDQAASKPALSKPAASESVEANVFDKPPAGQSEPSARPSLVRTEPPVLPAADEPATAPWLNPPEKSEDTAGSIETFRHSQRSLHAPITVASSPKANALLASSTHNKRFAPVVSSEVGQSPVDPVQAAKRDQLANDQEQRVIQQERLANQSLDDFFDGQSQTFEEPDRADRVVLHLSRAQVRSMTIGGRLKRVSIANRDVCQVFAGGANQIKLIGTGLGKTTLTIWADVAAGEPTRLQTFDIEVSEAIDATGDKFAGHTELLNDSIDIAFPRASVVVSREGGELVVTGRCDDETTATQIIRMVRKSCLIPVRDQLRVR